MRRFVLTEEEKKQKPKTGDVQYYSLAEPLLKHFDILPVEAIDGTKLPPCILFGVFCKHTGERVDDFNRRTDDYIYNYYEECEGRVCADCYYWIYKHGPQWIKHIEEEIEKVLLHGED